MEKNTVRPIRYGNALRMSYSRVDEVLEMPNLLALQKDSYDWFIKEGLMEAFRDISPISDYEGNLKLEIVGFELETNNCKYDIDECKGRDATYAAPLRVKAKLHNREADDFKEQQIYMGDFPLMTDTGTFVINGAERVIVSQLVRSPGIYYEVAKDKEGKNLISSTVIPNRGAWLEYETDSNDVFYVRVDRTRKVPVSVLIRSLIVNPSENGEYNPGWELGGTDEQIYAIFGDEPKIKAAIEKEKNLFFGVNRDKDSESNVDRTLNAGKALIELYKKLRSEEVATPENAKNHIDNMFYDQKRYDLAHVGRYKFNKKLLFQNRIKGRILAENVIDPMTGEVIASVGTRLTIELCDTIQDSAVEAVWVEIEGDDKRTKTKILSNMAVKIDEYIAQYGLTAEELGIKERVYFPALNAILEENDDKESVKLAIENNKDKLFPRHITFDDIIASINYCIHLDYGIGTVDDIDHLGNRRIRAVGELLQNQFKIGLSRMERTVRERMNTLDMTTATPTDLINVKPVTAAIKEFFGSSQLSQFMDQNNPLGELTHKRRLSALGPGGLSRERAGFEVRDVHSSHYGRMCPIETPEGPNIGLINSLASYARINEYGFIEAPYRKVSHIDGVTTVTDEVVYVTADEEEKFVIAQANEPLDENNHFVHEKVIARDGEDNVEVAPEKVDMMDVSPRQLVSVATALIPFLQNDDVTRALMGSNMQRQAVPLLTTDSAVVGTGMEYKTAKDSGVVVVAKADGVVEKVDAAHILVKNDDGKMQNYKLTKFQRSNQSNCMNQRPIVDKGERIKAGQIIADGPSTKNGELALGKNPLIGFMTWEGYNYEDAVLLSERLVMDDVYTSIHIEEYEAEARDTKLGPEEITRDIPNVGDEALRDLDQDGIIRIGAEVTTNDILVGKVTPKGETELTAEERLLRAIFGEKAREVRDNSLKVPHGESGIVVDVKKFSRENGDELPPGVTQLVRVYIAQKRKISVGDKMAGRHGNKGVVSRVLPVEDMPFLPNGRPLDIVLNPLGVPSRMNIGQVLEIHLGLASKMLGWKVATPVFEGANENDIMDTLVMANDYVNGDWEDFEAKYKDKINDDVFKYLEDNKDHREEWRGVPVDHTGKVKLRDGRTGEEFDNATTIGYMHYLKLHHLVDDKIHARSTGPYSLVTQQPLGGKAQFGGQRFGEMEVWALEAYGASYTLQEILTVKSDDVVGRVKTYEAIVKGENIPEPGVPESFKVLIKELQALGLDVRIMKNNVEVEIQENIDDEDNLNINIEGVEDPDQDGGDGVDNVLNKLTANDVDKEDDYGDDSEEEDDFDDYSPSDEEMDFAQEVEADALNPDGLSSFLNLGNADDEE